MNGWGWRWGGGGETLLVREKNDVRLSDNVAFFSASYPEPRQEADGCHMTPKRDSKKSKGPQDCLQAKFRVIGKHRKENCFGMWYTVG